MEWEAIGSTGEILGALAVVATLFYLTSQIRQGTRVARADMTKDLYLASRQAILDLASNETLARTWAEIMEFDDADESRRFTFYQSFFRLYELQFSLAKQELLHEGIAQSYELMIRAFAGTAHFGRYWERARSQFHEEFSDYVTTQYRLVTEEQVLT